MIKITFPDANDIVFGVSIDEKTYWLRMLWNQAGQFWTLHIMDKYKKEILSNIKVVRNFPLLCNKHCFDVPKGEFFITCNYEEPNRYSFATGEAVLYYATEEEVNAAIR